MKFLGVFVSTLSLAFVSAVSNGTKARARNGIMFEEVVGGTQIDIKYIRTQVAILELDHLLCSGNIIKDNVILSVAHTLHGKIKAHLKVRSGSNFYNSWGRAVRVAAIIIHSQYKHCTRCNHFDIALVVLIEPAVFHGIDASPIPLYDAEASFPAGTVGSVSGWGATEPNGPPSVALITIPVSIMDTDTCAVFYGLDTASHNLCGGNGFTHLCPGDAGAGLVINDRLAGIAAFGRHCGLAHTPSGYTSISLHRGWIREEAGV